MTQRVKRPRMSGAVLQKTVVDEGHRLGWYAVRIPRAQVRAGVYVTNASGSDNKGFVDLLLIRDRVIFVEIKGDGDSLTPEQKAWGERIVAAGGEYHVWKPKHWLSGEITWTLTKQEPRLIGVVAAGMPVYAE